jgi:hypothetical protein
MARICSGRTQALAASLALALAASGCGRPAAPTQPPVGRLQPAPPPTAGPVADNANAGAVFLGGSDLHTCSGSVLHSGPGNLILTAAHCLAGGYDATFATGLTGHDSASSWEIEAVYLDPRWLSAQDPVADYAIARVRRDAPGTLEAQVGGGLSVGAAPTDGSDVTVTGYALGVGGGPIGCSATTGTAPGGFPSLRCAGLVAGTSGAGWVRGSSVVGVIGGLDGGGCEEIVSYSPPFDDKVGQLLARAEQGGPADIPPAVFDDNC